MGQICVLPNQLPCLWHAICRRCLVKRTAAESTNTQRLTWLSLLYIYLVPLLIFNIHNVPQKLHLLKNKLFFFLFWKLNQLLSHILSCMPVNVIFAVINRSPHDSWYLGVTGSGLCEVVHVLALSKCHWLTWLSGIEWLSPAQDALGRWDIVGDVVQVEKET